MLNKEGFPLLSIFGNSTKGGWKMDVDITFEVTSKGMNSDEYARDNIFVSCNFFDTVGGDFSDEMK